MAGKDSKFILIFLSALFAIGVLATGCSTRDPELIKQASLNYDLGVMLLNKSDYPGAIQRLSAAERMNPDDALTYNALGLAYYGEGMKSQAEASYKKATGLNKNYSDAYNNLGVLYLSDSKWDDAINAFHSALANPLYMSPHIAWVNIGWAYYQKGQLDRAQKAYQSAIDIVPDLPIAHNNMGLIYLRKNMLQHAEYEFKTAIYYYKGYAEAHLNLGVAYMKGRNYTEARNQFETVLKVAPESPFAADAKKYIKMLR